MWLVHKIVTHLFLFSLRPQLGFTSFGEIFAYMTVWVFFLSNHRRSHIPSSWIMHTECVFVAGFTRLGHEYQDLLSARDGMSACTDYILVYTLIREFWGTESEPMLTPREKSSLPHSSEQGRVQIVRHDMDGLMSGVLLS